MSLPCFQVGWRIFIFTAIAALLFMLRLVTRSLCQHFLQTPLNNAVKLLRPLCFMAVPLLGLLLSGCALIKPASPDISLIEPISHPVRFLLTFDDGPSTSNSQNPTASILHDLEHNPIQPGIKALFFVQTRGATLRSPGRELLPREHADGHLIGFHTATSGHKNHRFLSHEDFIASLENGISDIQKVTGSAPKLVRPPFWNYDARTFDAYQMHGMHVLLTDLSANDGKIWGFNGSPRRRINLYNQLSTMRPKMVVGQIPVVDNVIPVVVTFHDTNPYTARHLHEYLQILLEVAAELNIPVSPQPFYQDKTALERAALARTIKSESEVVVLPGIWSWIWGSNPDTGKAKLAAFN